MRWVAWHCCHFHGVAAFPPAASVSTSAFERCHQCLWGPQCARTTMKNQHCAACGIFFSLRNIVVAARHGAMHELINESLKGNGLVLTFRNFLKQTWWTSNQKTLSSDVHEPTCHSAESLHVMATTFPRSHSQNQALVSWCSIHDVKNRTIVPSSLCNERTEQKTHANRHVTPS